MSDIDDVLANTAFVSQLVQDIKDSGKCMVLRYDTENRAYMSTTGMSGEEKAYILMWATAALMKEMQERLEDC